MPLPCGSLKPTKTKDKMGKCYTYLLAYPPDVEMSLILIHTLWKARSYVKKRWDWNKYHLCYHYIRISRPYKCCQRFDGPPWGKRPTLAWHGSKQRFQNNGRRYNYLSIGCVPCSGKWWRTSGYGSSSVSWLHGDQEPSAFSPFETKRTIF